MMTLVKHFVGARNWSLRLLQGFESAVNSKTKNRSVCENTVTGIWGSHAPSNGLLP